MSLDIRRDGRSTRPTRADPATATAGESSVPRRPAPAVVTAVVVARRATHLTAVLRAVESQSRRPDRVVGVDVGHDPGVRPRLAAHGDDVVHLAETATAGDAVTTALATAEAARLAPAEDPREASPHATDGAPEWVWVLDDHCAPAPTALARLLDVVDRSPRVALAGCKVRGGPDGRLLLSAGSTTSRWGRRITGVEAGEVDQGQLDGREDVLAVPPAGMLVRRDVWTALGGTDAALPDDAADLDLGRRVHLAGHRVVVVPAAVVTDRRDAGVADLPATATPVDLDPAGAARRDAAHLRLVSCRWWLLPFVALSVLVGGLARLVLAIAAKEPGRGVAGLAGAVAALSRPHRVVRARWRGARQRRVPRRHLRELQAGPREVARWHRTRWTERRLDGGRLVTLGTTLLDPPGTGPRSTGRVSLAGAVALVALLCAAAGTAVTSVLGDGPLVGRALTGLPAGVGDLWTAARSGWSAAGAGHAEPALPFTDVLAVLSALSGVPGVTGGSPTAAAAALLLAAAPLAGLLAWWAAGALTRAPGWRLLAGLAWAAAPPLLLAVGDGRLGAVLAHVLLPVAVRGLAGAAGTRHSRIAWCWAGGAALALVGVTAGAPVLLVPAALAVVVAAVAARRAALLFALLPSLALAAPRLATAADHPLVLVADPGPATAAGSAAAGWQLLLGWPVAPQGWADLPGLTGLSQLPGVGALSPTLLTATLLVVAAVPAALALAALASVGRVDRLGRAVRWGLGVAVVGLVVAVLAQHVRLLPGDDPAVTLWPGSGTSLLLLGLLAAGLAGTRRWSARPAGTSVRRPAPRRAAAAGVVVLALLPVAGLTAWSAAAVSARGSAGDGAAPGRGSGPALPAVVVDSATSPDQVRVLALRADPDGTTSVALLRGDGPAFETPTTATPVGDAADAALDAAVAELVSGGSGGTDPRAALAPFGVGAVALLPAVTAGGSGGPEGTGSADDATEALAARLGSTAGLTPSGSVDGLRAWRVEAASGPGSTAPDRPGALRVVDPTGPWTVLPATEDGAATDLPAGPAGRVLALAERADDGWRATLDGADLPVAAGDGWAQAWDLPSTGGRLEIWYDTGTTAWWGPAQLVLVVLAALVAVPVRQPREPGAPGDPADEARPEHRPEPADPLADELVPEQPTGEHA